MPRLASLRRSFQSFEPRCGPHVSATWEMRAACAAAPASPNAGLTGCRFGQLTSARLYSQFLGATAVSADAAVSNTMYSW